MITGHTTIGYSMIILILIIFLISLIFIFLEGKWHIKVLTTFFAFLLVFGTVFVWKSIQGTPKPTYDLDGILVRAYIIKEPSQDNPGKIWLWAFDQKGNNEPLNLEVPYTKQLHKELAENQGLNEGRVQRFKKKNPTKTFESERQFELFDPDPLKEKFE